ncbi:MAG: hypothetical protein JXR37_16135 [Kiritimatiellae bacterium]|nr:hypothetical protein [Kiritimatiellia bacterium]
MVFTYYPNRRDVQKAQKADDPLLLLVAYDESEALVSNIDDAFEHHVLLKKLGYSEATIDRYFRAVLNRDGADWTLVCPRDYKGIKDRNKRIETFYNDGAGAISRAAVALGCKNRINIPDRYRRHLDTLAK